MLQPQSDDEVRVVVDALRRIDRLLDVLWNPRAVMARKGSIDVHGKSSQPEFDGRWMVVRYETPAMLNEGRGWARLCLVTELTYENGVPIMVDHGPYAPVGQWLVDYIALWDRAQSRWQVEMDKLDAAHEKIDALDPVGDRAGHQDALERVYREHGGGAYWMGGAQGKADPATERALFPATTSP